MVMLELSGVGVAWAASVAVLKDVSLSLAPGFTAVVGANGAGKTTLLRVLGGELAPHEGSVTLRPRGAVVVSCPQDVDALAPATVAFAREPSSVAAELRGRLALRAEELERWGSLSPGERKRWQIGAALAREPDVLLLDEPTNHLDGRARGLLLAALRRFRGLGVVVSHDRQLLDELPRTTLFVHDGRVTAYAGGYSAARAARQEREEERERAHRLAKADVRALARRLDAARRLHSASQASRSSGARMKDVRDHDGRSSARKHRARAAEARAGRQVELVRAALERAEATVPDVARDRTLGGRVFAAFEPAKTKALFHVSEVELRAGARVVLRDVRVTITRDERVRIAGDNGAGKTTLVAALLRGGPDPERVLYLPQEMEPAAVASLASQLPTLEPAIRGRVLSLFAALGSDPERLVFRARGEEAKLSPGEARKLALAWGLGRHAWALVLDEPTNHLDLPSIERLEDALAGYPGCVVLVTHDDAFAAAVTQRTLRVADGVVT